MDQDNHPRFGGRVLSLYGCSIPERAILSSEDQLHQSLSVQGVLPRPLYQTLHVTLLLPPDLPAEQHATLNGGSGQRRTAFPKMLDGAGKYKHQHSLIYVSSTILPHIPISTIVVHSFIISELLKNYGVGGSSQSQRLQLPHTH